MKYALQYILLTFVGRMDLMLLPQVKELSLELDWGWNSLLMNHAGVKGDPRLMRPLMGTTSMARKQKSVYRARQESIFSKMKQFQVLDTRFIILAPKKLII